MQARELKLRGRVNIVIDAQRGEFYLAAYDVTDAAVSTKEPLRLAKKDEVQSRIAAGELVIGPEVDRWFTGARAVLPSAGALAMLANGRTDFVAGDQLEPLYLREAAFVKAPAPRTIPSL
jgi:tRNA A37 threonylcarbamoyladenosine modification protein TsaB